MSILAAILLTYWSSSTLWLGRPKTWERASISSGVLLDALPFPPATATPISPGSMASFRAAQVTVVVPLECQSYPRTQLRDWKNQGSESLRRSSWTPYSSMMMSTMHSANLTILLNSHLGALPWCRGRSAKPLSNPRATRMEGIKTFPKHRMGRDM